MKKVCSLTALSFLSAMLSAQAGDNMKVLPPAEAGMVRHVLQLPSVLESGLEHGQDGGATNTGGTPVPQDRCTL